MERIRTSWQTDTSRLRMRSHHPPRRCTRFSMHPLLESQLASTRRHFFRQLGVGGAALASLLNADTQAAEEPARVGGLPGLPHFAPTAKRVVYLFQSGAPSQMDLFDYKPGLADRRSEELPESIRQGQRLTGMT